MIALCLAGGAAPGRSAQAKGAPAKAVKIASFDQSLYKAMSWRLLGPFRGGRVTAVAGIPGRPLTYFFGATGGGVWKTEDGGLNWRCISDGYFKTGSVGALAVSEWDPNVVYAGMGEAPIRGNVSHGDGIYKSTDGGKTWKHVGLADTSQISRIRIHPRNPDLVYVAALGHVYGTNDERGVFRSMDGGKTWEKILFRSNKAGAIDLILDPNNSRVIFATFWEAFRTPHSLSSGGPGSGLFKSVDGGDTWTEISRNKGLPQGIQGKIGVTVSPAQPDRVWAIVEAEDGGVFRSDDGGGTWAKLNEDRRLRQRAWYYSRIYADPKNADSVYVLNTGFYKSADGGRTYASIPAPHGDNHDLWIDPGDPKRMINSNDGGANVSLNGGLSWTGQGNQPTAQFYHVAVDNQFPYWVYGAQQDNSTVRIASRTATGSIDTPDWHAVGGGESGFVLPKPDNPNIVYAGSYGGLLTRWDYVTRQERVITAWPDNPMGSGAGGTKFRYQWTAPILVSRFDPNVLYHAAQVLFRSRNEGQSWETISPDLTTNDKERQKSSGGPITQDNTSVEYYCTIFALAESFQDPKILWVGSDDGLVHMTKDGGKNWENITPREMGKWSLVSSIEPSSFDAATAYLAADRHELDDFKPYVYKTEDFGKTWKMIGAGMPQNTFVRVVREDPKRRGLLYAGTETGMFVSFNDGASWQSLQLNLPVVPVHDLVVKDNDLVAATHGRSFWILDDLTPLHQIDEQVAASDVFLFKPRDAYRMEGGGGFGGGGGDVGQNPPAGSVIYYDLKEKPKSEITLEFLDAKGSVIKKYTSATAGAAVSAEPAERPFAGGPRLQADAGMNRFVWNMRYPDAERVPNAVLWGGSTVGPVAPPGMYQVRLTVGGKTLTQSWEWKKDPRVQATQADLQEQFDFLIKIRDKQTEVNRAVNRLRETRSRIETLLRQVSGHERAAAIAEAAKKITNGLFTVEDNLIQWRSKSSQDPLNYPVKLDDRIAALAGVVANADAKPTDQSYELFKELSAAADAEIVTLKTILETDLMEFNKLIKEAGIPAIYIK